MSERADLEENIARERDAVKALAETNARQHKTDPGDVLRTRPAGVRRKGRRAQGTHGPKGRAPKGAEREAPKAPSVPADVLRGTGFRAHKPTSPAQAQHKPSTSPGTSPEETNSFTDRKKNIFIFFFFLKTVSYTRRLCLGLCWACAALVLRLWACVGWLCFP